MMPDGRGEAGDQEREATATNAGDALQNEGQGKENEDMHMEGEPLEGSEGLSNMGIDTGGDDNMLEHRGVDNGLGGSNDPAMDVDTTSTDEGRHPSPINVRTPHDTSGNRTPIPLADPSSSAVRNPPPMSEPPSRDARTVHFGFGISRRVENSGAFGAVRTPHFGFGTSGCLPIVDALSRHVRTPHLGRIGTTGHFPISDLPTPDVHTHYPDPGNRSTVGFGNTSPRNVHLSSNVRNSSVDFQTPFQPGVGVGTPPDPGLGNAPLSNVDKPVDTVELPPADKNTVGDISPSKQSLFQSRDNDSMGEDIIIEIPDSAPNWLKMPLALLSAIDLGDSFRRLLNLLIRLEVCNGFKNGKRGFLKAGRPAQLTVWIVDGRGRSGASTLVTDTISFGKTWRAWWISLQPKWRCLEDASNWPSEVEEYGDEWDTLDYPGANGFLGVVACLYWWGCSVQGKVDGVKVTGPVVDWEEAVIDVGWILQGILAWKADN